jgi:lysophospholipase L1-like esterase
MAHGTPDEAAPRTRISTAILLVTLSTVLALSMAELCFRLTYKQPWYDRLIGEQKPSIPIPKDPLGFAVRPAPRLGPKAADTRRIMFLGDSFTYGQDVAESAAVFPGILERELSAQPGLPGVNRVEVLNGGIPGSLTGDWVRYWSSYHQAFQPDLVVIVFFLRDGTRTASIPEFFGKIRRQIVRRNAASALYQRSYIARYLQDQIDRRDIADKYIKAFSDSYFGEPPQNEEWLLAQENLRKIRSEAQKTGTTVGFVVFPVLVELQEGYPFQRICDLLEAFGKREGMPVHNLLPAFMGRNGPDLWVSAFNQHPNELGHRIAADSLRPFLTQLLATHEARRVAGR